MKIFLPLLLIGSTFLGYYSPDWFRLAVVFALIIYYNLVHRDSAGDTNRLRIGSTIIIGIMVGHYFTTI